MQLIDQYVLIDISGGKIENLTDGENLKNLVEVNGKTVFSSEEEANKAALSSGIASVAVCHRNVSPWQYVGQIITSNKEEFIQ